MWSASVVTHTAANLSVALNLGTAGQPEGVFLSVPTRYDFYTPPVVHSLVPASGPMADAPLVLVEAHRLGTFASLVGVSATPIFLMHPLAIIESIEPSEGPALGGTLIAVRGLHLHYGERHAYRCRLGQHRVVASYVPADGSVRCTTPPQHDLAYKNSNDAAVHVALNMALGSFAAQLNASSHNASSEQCALVASAAIDLAQPEPPLRRSRGMKRTHYVACSPPPTTTPPWRRHR
jgi:hypothetical protein